MNKEDEEEFQTCAGGQQRQTSELYGLEPCLAREECCGTLFSLIFIAKM